MVLHFVVVYIICFFASYLIGSIPFSWIVTKIKTGKDIRQVGSKNVGGRNVYRATNSKFLAYLAGLLDVCRSIAAILAPYFLSRVWYFANFYSPVIYPYPTPEYDFVLTIVGFGAILGHNWPLYLFSHGGKGITVVIATCLSLNPILLGFWIVLWPIIITIIGYSSITYIVVTLLVGIIAFFLPSIMVMRWAQNPIPIALILLIISLIMLSRQKENFQKIRSGEAKKMRVFKALGGKSKMSEEILK